MGDTTTNYKITATYQEALSAFERINAEIGEGAVTIKGMTDKAEKLNKELRSAKLGSEAFTFLKTETVKANQAISDLTKKTGDYNMVGMNTARLFSDAGYAAQSFSFGVMAIGNNISPLVESLQRARTAGQSWKEILVSTFTGMSGWLVSINLLVSAFTAWSIMNRDSAKDIKETTKAIKSQKEEMEDYINNVLEPERKKSKQMNMLGALLTDAPRLRDSKKSLDEQIAALKIVAGEYKKAGDSANYFATTMAVRDLQAQLDVINDKLRVVDIGAKEIINDFKSLADNDKRIERLKKEADSMGFLVALYGDYIDKIQRAMLIQASSIAEARGLKDFQISGAVAVPNRPDMTLTQKEIEELQDKRIVAITKQYNNVFNTAGKIGNLLQNSFDKAGTGFISQLNEALQIVIQIADIMEMTGLLKMIIGGATAVATGGAGAAVAGVIPGFLPIPRMQQAPTIVNVQLGTATVARVVAQGNQLAQELRY